MVLAMLGKMFVSAAFGMIFVYAAEVFPTVVRAFVIGTCAAIGKSGSIASPYVYHLVRKKALECLACS